MPTLTTEQFIERARKIHGDRYDYSKVVYVNNHTKIEIICSEHGSFFQKPNGHLSKNGCLLCANKNKGSYRRNTLQNFVETANLIHNNKYIYDKVYYTNNHTKVEIICPIHGSFFQKPNHHISSKRGCYKCVNKTETLCRDALEKIVGKQFPKCRPKFLEGLEYDGYNVELKLAFEYSGIQHFKSLPFFGGDKRLKQQQINDEKKTKIIKTK